MPHTDKNLHGVPERRPICDFRVSQIPKDTKSSPADC